MRISAVVLTRNEEKNIVECLKSLAFCEEILVVDDYSTDRTVDLIRGMKKANISIIHHPLNGNFSQSRNFGLSKVKGDWVLYVDADERVSTSLAFEIGNTIRLHGNSHNGFYIRRVDVLWGKRLRHGEVGDTRILRLGKKGFGNWEGVVHEEWNIKGRTGNLKGILLHYPHQTLKEFIREIDFYTTLRAQELHGYRVKVTSLSIGLYPLGKFLLNYLVKKGFLDGVPGFIHAMLMAFHSYLVRAKLWQINERIGRK